MAIIYAKPTTSSPEQCLVLGVREALIYPFDVGDWNEIRIGMYFALCSASSLTDTWSAEIIYNGATNPRNNCFIGLKDSGTALPQTTGYAYMGWGIGKNHAGLARSVYVYPPNSTVGFFQPGRNPYGGAAAVLSYNGTETYKDAPQWLGMTSQTNATGLSTYAALYVMRFLKATTAGGKTVITGQLFFNDNNSSAVAPYTTEGLRTTLLNISNNQFNNVGIGPTGYWTDTLSPAGNNLPLPNSVFMYLPFFSNRARIHALVVEKIS